MKKTYLFALFLLCVLTSACHFFDIQSSKSITSSEPLKIKVMSFNIRYGTANDGPNNWNNRKKLVYDVIRKAAPDVIGLQEALRFQIDDIRKTLPEYAAIGVSRDGGLQGEYSAILYRSDRFDVESSETRWLSNTPKVPSADWGNAFRRIVTWGHFTDKKSKRGFYLYNTHLDHQSQNAREKSVRLIIDIIQNRTLHDPFILTGDFNAGENNPVIKYLKGLEPVGSVSPIPLQDTFRMIHPDQKNAGTLNGFQGKTDSDKIDYIFVAPNTETLDATIIRTNRRGRYPSDHFPITANIRIEASIPK